MEEDPCIESRLYPKLKDGLPYGLDDYEPHEPREPRNSKNFRDFKDIEGFGSYDISVQNLKQKLGELRLRDFESDLSWICEKIANYKKLHGKWKKMDSVIRYADIIVGTTIGITGGIILTLSTSGIWLFALAGGGTIVLSTLTALPILNSIALGVLNLSVFKSKIIKYEGLVRELEVSKNKLFLFHQKALKDEVLTDEEINILKSMVAEIKEKVLQTLQAENSANSKNSKKSGNSQISNNEILKQLEDLKFKILRS